MTPELLVELAWKSALTSGLALLLVGMLRNRSAGERSWLAHTGLAATVLVPLLVLFGPRWQVSMPMAIPAAAVPIETAPAGSPPVERAGSGATGSGQAHGSSADQGTRRAWAAALPLLIYGTPAVLLVLALLLSVVRLYRLQGRAHVVVEQAWLTALARAQQRAGFKHGTALLVSRELSSPISWGVLRPVIVLGQETARSPAQAEAVIAHELAHLARLDWAKLLVGRTATAIFWFNPLVWLLARQCHQLREETADDAVLATEIADTEYAALLVGAARHESRGWLLAANGVAPGPGSLKRRVARVLDLGSNRAPVRLRWSSACAVGALLLAAPLASLAPVAAMPAPGAATAPPSPVPASRGTAVALARFTSVELRGGGQVVLRHGATQRVSLVGGNPEQTRLTVDDRGRLAIEACTARCAGYAVEIDIVTPALAGVAIRGGGSISAEGDFPLQPSLAAAVKGGGALDVQRLPANRVTAAVAGGGTIVTDARTELTAAIHAGGTITYWGDPEVTSAVSGGGVITRGDGR